jgi:hypothetical protein
MKEFIKRMLSWFGPIQTPPPAQVPVAEEPIVKSIEVSNITKVEQPMVTNKPKKSKPAKPSINKPKPQAKQKSEVKKQQQTPRATPNKPKKSRKSNNE